MPWIEVLSLERGKTAKTKDTQNYVKEEFWEYLLVKSSNIYAIVSEEYVN